MEFGKLALAIVAVYGSMFFVGMIISLASSGIQCGKIDAGEHAKQGAIWATYPAVVYGLTVYFPILRRFAVNTLRSKFGLGEQYVEIVAVGYLMMLISWIATVWNISSTEKAVCNPSVDEMAEFKQKLTQKLKEKQEAEEKNNEAKQNPAPPA
jgi:hypothetical protein